MPKERAKKSSKALPSELASEPDASVSGRGKARGRPRASKSVGDELGAAELARKVADSLRSFRRARDLSLDELSARSGVSRAALSQIEGGRTNPTLAVLWKVAVGLDVPFHELIATQSEEPVLVLRAGASPPLQSGDGRTESRLLSPGGAPNDTEVYELRLQPKAVHRSDPHARGTSETLIVLTGALRLGAGQATYELSAGDCAFFKADTPHSYENRSARETRCINIIHYSRSATSAR